MTRTTPYTVCLTGGIASGKSAVSDRFALRGIRVVDTDVIAREVVAPGTEGLAAIREAFGEGVMDAKGGLDRQAMRDRIFADPDLRQRLEAIVHPRVVAESRRQIAAADSPWVLVVVPLLVETGLFGEADRVLVVDVPEETQIRRLMNRDGSTRQQAEAILAAQASREARLAVADDVIKNDGKMDALDAAVEELDRKYRGYSGG